MPLYEYFCSDCRAQFTALRPMSQADTPIECENCEGQHTARVLSLFSARSPHRRFWWRNCTTKQQAS